MGYRSTFVTSDMPINIPNWFVEKWQASVYINNSATFPIASKQEMKEYGHWADLATDIQRILKEDKDRSDYTISLVFLHEDGLITLYNITAFNIEQVLKT